jgi:ABC-type protease/lipase transport system fused ATPase/permease subunit
MSKGTIILIVLVLGIIVAGAAAILFVLNLGSESSTARAMQGDEPDGRAGTFSAGARVAFRDFIQAQGLQMSQRFRWHADGR